jgi:signal transduction histidine kinase
MATPWVRIQSALLAAVLVTALAVNLLLHRPTRRVYQEYAVFALNLALWFLSDALHALLSFESEPLNTVRMLVATAIPITTARFFQVLMEDKTPGAHRLQRILIALAIPTAVGVVILPQTTVPIWILETAFLTYIFGGVVASIFRIWYRLASIEAATERGRFMSLLIAAGIAILAVFLDYLPDFGYFFFGNIFVMLFLYFLFQIVTKLRLLDLYEFLGRSVVTLTFALVIAAIFLFLTGFWRHRADLFVFNTVIGALVINILFEPLRNVVANWIGRFLFGERFAFVARLEHLQSDLAKVVEPQDLAKLMVTTLDESRRVTHASVYLVGSNGRHLEVAEFVGSVPRQKIDFARDNSLLDLLMQEHLITREQLDDNLKSLRYLDTLDAQVVRERTTAVIKVMEELYAAVIIPFVSKQQVIGFLALNDDRLREPYASEELNLLHKVATQATIALENSLIYDKLRERDRLAALGEMSAGLAHEIRNPLGAIRGAAQLLPGEENPEEFAKIIVEEVDRLDVVVTQFLHFAKPYASRREQVDVNDLVRRTTQLIEADLPEGVQIEEDLDLVLPDVTTDPEMVRTIFVNLARNAVEAMGEEGSLTVRTSLKKASQTFIQGHRGVLVVVEFQDTGPGIKKEDVANIFIPFFTTKSKGTGLGLSICQRVIKSLGGFIEVQSKVGEGTTFSVNLPTGGISTTAEILVTPEPASEKESIDPT